MEERVAVCTIYVGADTRVERMRLEDITQENRLDERFALMENDGLANNLHLSTDVSGTNLRIVLDNDNRSKGGSRGAYSRIK